MVTFLATHSKRGNVRVTGPATGIDYLITPSGTPVSDYDVPELLKITAPPCCGEVLPFGGQVKLFGRTSASAEQVKFVPEHILKAKKLTRKQLREMEEAKEEKEENRVEVSDTVLHTYFIEETDNQED